MPSEKAMAVAMDVWMDSDPSFGRAPTGLIESIARKLDHYWTAFGYNPDGPTMSRFDSIRGQWEQWIKWVGDRQGRPVDDMQRYSMESLVKSADDQQILDAIEYRIAEGSTRPLPIRKQERESAWGI